MTRAAGGLIDVADMPSGDGWEDLPLAVGITGDGSFPPEYLRLEIGDGTVLVFLRGRISGVVAATNDQIIGSLPANATPAAQSEIGIMPCSSSVKGRLWVTADATSNVRCRTDSGTAMFLGGSFVASP